MCCPCPRPAGGFEGHALLFFALSLAIVAAGTLLFTAAGDVDTQLGAGSAAAAADLPVAYRRVPGGAPPPGSKDPAEALEELHRQRQLLREAPPTALPNPFDVRGRGPAFMPLPAADEAWPPPYTDAGGPASGAASPLAVEASAAVAAPASPPGAGDTPRSPLRRSSCDVAAADNR